MFVNPLFIRLSTTSISIISNRPADIEIVPANSILNGAGVFAKVGATIAYEASSSPPERDTYQKHCAEYLYVKQ
jgi:hypothetical protein